MFLCWNLQIRCMEKKYYQITKEKFEPYHKEEPTTRMKILALIIFIIIFFPLILFYSTHYYFGWCVPSHTGCSCISNNCTMLPRNSFEWVAYIVIHAVILIWGGIAVLILFFTLKTTKKLIIKKSSKQ